MIASKTRVAPLKGATIPRLELCGALLLSELLSVVASAIGSNKESLFAWTDSSIVLSWLNASSKHLKAFVLNRVNNILDLVPATRWRQVPTASNLADIASRGALARELLSSDLWWHGPPWLTANPSDWPLPSSKCLQDDDTEVKHISCPAAVEEPWLINRFSKYGHLVRVVGWIKRFVDNCKTKVMDKSNLTCALSVYEFKGC